MAILIDPPAWPAHGRLWSHLVSDSSFEELHAFAHALGVPERGFEGDHYDVPQERYAAAVTAGAQAVAGRELLGRLRRAGLRRPKRRGERVLASRLDPTGARIDTITSSLPPTRPVTAGWLLARGAAGTRVAPLGADGPPPGARAIGYLRRQPAEGAGPVTVEPVLVVDQLALLDPSGAGSPRWIDAAEAVVGMPALHLLVELVAAGETAVLG